ncbi:galactose mutarotase-like enzyme [Flavobacterium sp. 7E]|uniref:aldose 1-epimerase family protein n=1 Tax=Flavobacterium sp. 7E TaxID=2735898 RepID=UPI00156FA783|nr:aldose 1-epimerase family protein [Flavobacterium sp. 7E]NRS88830.1 galactose mutarotase-like enzyme [Flavobacterium sp. 7E]
MTTTIITNSFLSAEIKHAGAELCSLKKITNNKEYIWEGNPEFWGKHSPILFPIVGTLKDNKYTYNNQQYTLSRHGFARDMVFDLIEKKEDRVTFSLKSTEETLKVYPFEFELQICYQLIENEIVIKYQVINKGDLEMGFSIGAHPAFALPSQFENYTLEFEKEEPLIYTLLENNLLSDETKRLDTEVNSVRLNYSLFEKDALIFKLLASKSVTILENKTPMLNIRFDDFPHLGIWTLNNAPFICIEPWFGYSDTSNNTGNIMEKEGIQLLAPKNTFDSNLTIAIL